MATFATPQPWIVSAVAEGLAIPAHPLALTEDGRLDECCQRALTRYYAAAGAGGLAVGVHTTQFEIREPGIGLYRPVLQCASETLDELELGGGRDSPPGSPRSAAAGRMVRIAGICGRTPQAVSEAATACSLGYHAGLLSLVAMDTDDAAVLIGHCRAVAEVIPLIGFYLQAGVGGRRLGFDFWRRFAEIPNVVAIKMAPFNRYQTLDVIRGVAASGRAGQVALYTGNDDNIVVDLLTRFDFAMGGTVVSQQIVGGLLGHWAVWTRAAVDLFRKVRAIAAERSPVPAEMLSLAAQVTDCNAALFDVANHFAGCIAGIQYVLHQQGLIRSAHCLNPAEVLSPGQADEIDRVRREYPHLVDDPFIAANISNWRS